MKKTIAWISMLILLLILTSLPVCAANATLTIRVEGPEENLYYKENVIMNIDSETTLYEVLYGLDASGAVDFEGIEVGYISSVNGISAARTDLGWDCYGVMLNNKRIGWDEIKTTKVQSGDSIIVYYSDEFGQGFCVPIIDDSNIESGKIRFVTHTPVVDRPNSYTIDPIKDAIVRWYIGEDYVEFNTKDTGEIVIDRGFLSSGLHKIEIIKTNENGTTAILRLAPDTTVNVPTAVGDSPMVYYLAALMLISAIGFAVLLPKKKKN